MYNRAFCVLPKVRAVMSNKVTAIILAGGGGSRMGTAVAKQLITLCGMSVIERSISAFSECENISDIVVVSRIEDMAEVLEITRRYPKVKQVCEGGGCRVESAKIGFLLCDNDTDTVAIHDAARCLVTPEMISKVIKTAEKYGAATAATSVVDTLKRVNDNGEILETVSRENLWSAQTPQAFSYGIYKRAITEFYDESVTDDNSLVERMGISVKVVDLGKENIKITYSDDLPYAQYIINKREKKQL